MDTQKTSSENGERSQQKPNSTESEESFDHEGLVSDPGGDTEATENPSAADAAKAELAEFKDRYVRLMAEVENMRRRMEREKAELAKFVFEGFFKDLLPTLDSLEKALPEEVVPASRSQGGDSHNAYLEGMAMVKRQLLDVLRRHGLEAVRAQGAEFDPNLHQAIQRIESSDVEKDTVKDEYALGYTLHGRLLRAAMVSVLTPAGGD
jgi:molecular chaperone GrpE